MRRQLRELSCAWRSWLLVSGELSSLAIFRIGWAVAMLVETYQDRNSAALYAPGHYHLALASWAQPVSSATYAALTCICAVGCVMTLIGFLAQLGALAVVLADGYLFAADLLLFRNHIYLGLLFGLLLAISPCGRALSVDAAIRALVGRSRPAIGSRACVQLIKAQVVIVYAWSAINKLRPSFVDGWTLQQELPYALDASALATWVHLPDGSLRPSLARRRASDSAMALCSCAVVLVEAFLALGLARARLRRPAIVLGLAFHCAVFLCMDVLTFGLMLISSYPLFVAARDRRAR